MRSLQIDYSEQFAGLDRKPDSYSELADRYEWAKRDVDQDIEGHLYDECNDYLDAILESERDRVIVECGCGLGRNLHRFADANICIGIDFSTTCLQKIQKYGSGIMPLKADIRRLPLADQSADYVIFCNVLFIYEEIEQIVHMLSEARRILKPSGRCVVINDYCSIGVLLAPFLQLPFARLWRRRKSGSGNCKEFMLYYFGERDGYSLLERAGLRQTDSRLCNFHMGVYHLTYLSPIWGGLLRHHRRHRKVRRMDHWERVRLARCVNDAYPLNLMGRIVAALSRRMWPQFAALSLCCTGDRAHAAVSED
jgi:SAM-dependent methyltransferase